MGDLVRSLLDHAILRQWDWQPMVGSLLLAFVLGQLVAWTYVRTHSDLTYSRSQVQALVLLALIVTVVMLAVGNNMARAFGLFGALALIRFRTPVKDARDSVFLFLSVGVGISVGAGLYLLALIATAFLCAIALYLHKVHFGERIDHNAVLRFSLPAELQRDPGLQRLLSHYCRSTALTFLRDTGRDDTMEFSYQVILRDPQSSTHLLADLRAIPGVSSVNLLLQNEDVEP